MPPSSIIETSPTLPMLRLALLITLLLPFSTPLHAQSKEEQKFNLDQAKILNSYAQTAYKKGFPKIARRVWLMLLSEYDPDNKAARTALGYERVGNSWALRSDFVYPKSDKPDAGAAKALQAKWQSTAKKIAANHKRQAEKYAKAGRTDMSLRHYKKVIFFAPDDKDAQEALEYKPVAGLTGTDLEQTLFERSKKIEKVVAEEAHKDYPVEVLGDDATQPFLEKAKVSYHTVKSEHFIVRGDFEVELLMEAARYAERAIRVMDVVTEGYDGFNRDPNRWVRDEAYFQDKSTYVQVLQANADLTTPDNLAFLVENTRGTTLFTSGVALGISAPLNEQGVYDGAVRSVAQAYSGLRTPAMREGIGHTIVGLMFNNNRSFIVDRKKQLQTTTGEEDIDKFSPNMDTWGELALEAAWKMTEGTPAANLPLITADKFPDDARIKSWSFCDYLVRRDPTLLHALDSLADQRNPIKVEKEFIRRQDGLSLAQLEKEWKDFWTGASPVLKAIKNDTPPLTTVNKDVKKWLEAFNKERTERGVPEVTWSSDYSGRCREHALYLALNPDQRGPSAEQHEDANLEGGSHIGDMFAEMALVETHAGKPKDVFNAWMHLPGYRDALINQSLRTIGLYVEDDILVIDAIRGLGRAPEGKGGYVVYPNNPQQAVPNRVAVADLGEEVAALLEREGREGQEYVGYPISLHHFGNGGLAGERDSYKCVLKLQGEIVPGFLHMADGGSNRRSSAPGMVVFYPFEPLKKGRRYEAVWTFEHSKGTARTEVKFQT